MWCQCWRSPHLEFEPGEPRCQCWQFQVHVLLQQFPCTKGDDISNMWILRNVHLVYVIYTLIWDSNLEAMNISVAPFTDIDISVVVFFLQYNKKFYLPNLTVVWQYCKPTIPLDILWHPLCHLGIRTLRPQFKMYENQMIHFPFKIWNFMSMCW